MMPTFRCTFLYSALLVLAWPIAAISAEIHGRVVKVSDGDTVTVLDNQKTQHKVRLYGIDAPENSQPFGQRSKQHLSGLVFDKQVSVLWDKRDKYGRIVGKVLAPTPDCHTPVCVSTLDVSLSQIQAGMAWWFRRYAKEQSVEDQQLYEMAEIDAKARRVGVWSDNVPQAPWDFRQDRKAR